MCAHKLPCTSSNGLGSRLLISNASCEVGTSAGMPNTQAGGEVRMEEDNSITGLIQYFGMSFSRIQGNMRTLTLMSEHSGSAFCSAICNAIACFASLVQCSVCLRGVLGTMAGFSTLAVK